MWARSLRSLTNLLVCLVARIGRRRCICWLTSTPLGTTRSGKTRRSATGSHNSSTSSSRTSSRANTPSQNHGSLHHGPGRPEACLCGLYDTLSSARAIWDGSLHLSPPSWVTPLTLFRQLRASRNTTTRTMRACERRREPRLPTRIWTAISTG